MWTDEQKEMAKIARERNKSRSRNYKAERRRSISYLKQGIVEAVAKAKEPDYQEDYNINKQLWRGRKIFITHVRKEVIRKKIKGYMNNKSRLRSLFRQFKQGGFDHLLDEMLNDLYEDINKVYVNKNTIKKDNLRKVIGLYKDIGIKDNRPTAEEFRGIVNNMEKEFFKESLYKDYFQPDNDPIIDQFMADLFQDIKKATMDRMYWNKILTNNINMLFDW